MAEDTTRQLTKEEAVSMYDGKEWADWTDEQIVKFQLYQCKLCVDWDRFRKAIEVVMGRGVSTHEFASSNIAALRAEYEGKRQKPTMQDIVDLLPKDKTIVVAM